MYSRLDSLLYILSRGFRLDILRYGCQSASSIQNDFCKMTFEAYLGRRDFLTGTGVCIDRPVRSSETISPHRSRFPQSAPTQIRPDRKNAGSFNWSGRAGEIAGGACAEGFAPPAPIRH